MRGRTNENYTRALNVASDVPFLSPDLLHFASRPPHSQNTLFLHSKGNSPVSTIVGYAQSDLKAGGTLITPQFASLDGANYDLNKIVAVGEDIVDNVEVQTLNAFGQTVSSYMWVDYLGETPCWMDNDSFAEAEGVSLAPGQGLWIFGSSTNQGVQTAGKVGLEDVSVSLISGASAVGNPFPVAVDLQDVVALGDDIVDNVEIQTLNAFGQTVGSYMWVDYLGETPCWMDNDSFEAADGVTVAPGQALWVFGTSTSQSICFPAPEL